MGRLIGPCIQQIEAVEPDPPAVGETIADLPVEDAERGRLEIAENARKKPTLHRIAQRDIDVVVGD
jgi:hypothetical protein